MVQTWNWIRSATADWDGMGWDI